MKMKKMKTTFLLILTILIGVTVNAQENTALPAVKTDTVVVEKVRVDTVFFVEKPQQQTVPVQQSQPSVQPAKKPVINQNKLYFGGYVNATFGGYTVIGIEPLVGYKLTPRLSVGGKLSYEYISDKRYEEEYSGSNYGFSLFTRLRVTQRLYAHTEYSAINYKLFYTDGHDEREWVPFLFLGGGISQPISRNTWVTAEVLFDVLQNEDSPYSDWEPFFSVGFGVGF
jgi:hypothetical protein